MHDLEPLFAHLSQFKCVGKPGVHEESTTFKIVKSLSNHLVWTKPSFTDLSLDRGTALADVFDIFFGSNSVENRNDDFPSHRSCLSARLGPV